MAKITIEDTNIHSLKAVINARPILKKMNENYENNPYGDKDITAVYSVVGYFNDELKEFVTKIPCKKNDYVRNYPSPLQVNVTFYIDGATIANKRELTTLKSFLQQQTNEIRTESFNLSTFSEFDIEELERDFEIVIKDAKNTEE